MGPKVGIRGVPEPEAVTRGWGGMAETDGTDEGPAAGATVWIRWSVVVTIDGITP